MIAPIEKARSGVNDIIQIVVTRICDEACSNCTQLLPFRQDVKHMSPDVFRLALRSLDGWPGVRAMFGGNCCAHPQFPELCRIMQDEVPDQRQRGLWTNNLFKHGEIARQTFWPRARFNLNVHRNAEAATYMRQALPGIEILGEQRASWHGPILMHWRDLGLSEQEWVTAREGCDINRRWSAAIVEREGAPFSYFCEVASALDGVRGENNGIPAVPGWWQEPMATFEHQVRACCDRGCGVPLKYKGQQDWAECYDLSPSMVKLTMSERLKTKLQVHVEPPTEKSLISTDYMRKWS